MIVADDFTYPDGVLHGQDGGTDGVGSWLNPWGTSFVFGGVEVSGGVAQGAILGNNPRYASRTFDNPGSTNQLFVSFDMYTPDVINEDDYFFIAMTLGVNNNLMAFGKSPGSNKFQIGNGGFSSSVLDILPNTAYHLVGAYDIRHIPNGDPDHLSLWVNPDASDFYNTVTGIGTADVFDLDFVAFHAATATFFTNTAPGYRFDNLVISNDAEGVGLNRSPVVPEPSALALAAIGFAGLGVRARRRGLRNQAV
jgi:hypothetical protein